MESEREQWLRAQALYTQVLQLGPQSPHRADALFSLGWIEYRLGNRTEARNHFECFKSHFPKDPRYSEALALALIARAEEGLIIASRMINDQDFQLQSFAMVRLEETVRLIETDLCRVSNRAYRAVLQDIALQAILRSLPVFEEFGEFFRADFLRQQLRKIMDFAPPDFRFCEILAEIICSHAYAAKENPNEARRRERAIRLLFQINSELHRFSQLSESRHTEYNLERRKAA